MCLTMLLPLGSYTMIMYDDVCMYVWCMMIFDAMWQLFDETVHGRPTEQIMSWY